MVRSTAERKGNGSGGQSPRTSARRRATHAPFAPRSPPRRVPRGASPPCRYQGGEDTPYPHWAELLEACEEFAVLSGWRFILVDFMRMDAADGTAGAPIEAAARARAMPTALHYADRVRARRAAGRRAGACREA